MTGRLVAIDPGRSGGIAWLDWLGDIHAEPMPAAQIPKLNKIRAVIAEQLPSLVIVEDVGYHRHGNSAQSSAALARDVGGIEATVRAMGCEIYWLPPKVWAKAPPFDLLPKFQRLPACTEDKLKQKAKRDHDRRRKNLIKRMMAEHHPACRMTLATADAVAMIHWALQSKQIALTVETAAALAQMGRHGVSPTPEA
jgi:hypothetical protein